MDVPTEPVRRSGAWQHMGLVAMGLVLGVGAGWLVSRQAASTTPATQPLVRFSTSFEATGEPGQFDRPMLTVSPDGRGLVFCAKGASGVPQLHLRRLDQLDDLTLAGTEGATAPFFSADGESVAFFAGGHLKKLTLRDRAVQTVGDAPSWGGAWTRDAAIFFSGAPFSGGLMRLSSSGGTRTQATKLGPGEADHRWPSVSPDGRVVVYTTTNSAGPGLEEPHVVAESLVSGQKEVLPVEATYALFAPGGRHLLLVRRGNVRLWPLLPTVSLSVDRPYLSWTV